MKLIPVMIAFIAAPICLRVEAQTNPSVPTPPPAETTPVATADPNVHNALLFRPPTVPSGGVLPVRVGGGSRGAAGDNMMLEVLVPDQVALTTQAQPSLYWYQSKEAATQCEVTLTEPNNPKSLLKLKSPAPTPAGIHAIRLSKFNVQLQPGVIYRWSVAVIVDPENRSQDILANGVIKRTDLTPDLAGKLAQASSADKTAIYAANGFWYDALQSISDQIDLNPKDTALRAQRVDLLNQIGIDASKMDGLIAKQ